MSLPIQELALRQLRDYHNRTPGTYFGEQHYPLDLDQAYALQAAVAHLRVERGDSIVGYKVGCTGPGILKQFGMRGPIRAYLFDSELRQSSESLDHKAFANLAIEGEMAAQIGESGGVSAAFPVIELHNYAFRGERPTLVELIANNGINAGVVLPALDARPSSEEWPADSVLTVKINGETTDSGGLWPMPGGVPASIDWLRGNLERYGLSLDPGHLVLLGTPLRLHPISPGDHVVISVNGSDYVECYVS